MRVQLLEGWYCVGRNAQVQRSAQQCDAINHELSFSCSPCGVSSAASACAACAISLARLNAEHDQASSARPLRALTGFFTARKNNRTPTFSVPLSLVPGPKNERGLESRKFQTKRTEKPEKGLPRVLMDLVDVEKQGSVFRKFYPDAMGRR